MSDGNEKTVEELQTQIAELTKERDSSDERAKNFQGQLTTREKDLERFGDMDPEKYKAILEENAILQRQSAGISEDKFKDALEESMQSERESHKGTLDEKDAAINSLTKEINSIKINSKAWVPLQGVKDDMKPFVTSLINKHAIIEDDKLYAIDADGKKLMSKKDPTLSMGWEEFAEDLSTVYPSAFEKQIPTTTASNGKRQSASNGGMSLVERLKNPDTAKHMTNEEKRQAGAERAARARTF